MYSSDNSAKNKFVDHSLTRFCILGNTPEQTQSTKQHPHSQNMAVFTVFTHNESTKYKTTVCSKSMLFVALTTFTTVLLPLMFAYRSQGASLVYFFTLQAETNFALRKHFVRYTLFAGFWIKTLSYREQPVVHFKSEYFIYLETDSNADIIICSTIRNPTRYLQELDRCSSIKVTECFLIHNSCAK